MRWFVEVSHVGESSIAEKYCVEAKQWQAALQEARKLRGDAGALSKFSIELLDRGYRAVDPALKLRYLIDEAPADAPLSEERPNDTSSDKLRVAEPVQPTTSFAPSSPSLVPNPGGSIAPRPNSGTPPRPTSVSPSPVRASAPSIVPSVAPRSQQLLVPHDPVPPAPAPRGSMPPFVPVEVPLFELVRQRAEDPRAESPITYRELAFAVQPGATRAQIEALLHDRYQATLAAIEDRPPGKFVQLAVFDHVFKRRPERPPLATFAWKDWRGDPVLAFPGFGEEPMGPMSQIPPAPVSMLPSMPSPTNGHASPSPSKRPSMPPASLSSLPLPPSLAPASVPASAPVPSVVPDSRPVIPMAPVVIESKPPVSATPAAAEAIAVPVAVPPPAPLDEDIEIDSAPAIVAAPVVPEPARVAPVVAETAPVFSEPPPVVVDAAPVVSEPPPPVVVEPAAISEPSAIGEPSAISEPAAISAPFAPVVSAPVAPAPRPGSSPGFDLNFEAPAPVDRGSSPDRASRPRLAVSRRRAGEDLIGELFEIMHDLHFMRDVAAGAEFVMAVLDEVLPCEGALVHVFDIDTSHFVIVRAKGPHAANILLQRMPDQDPMVRSVMRGGRATHVKDVSNTPKFLGPRWPALGVQPRTALCGPVKQGGRYLGLIELVNPLGDTPFHQSELNALDYICEQFAEFLSKKPIVLTADVVLAKS